MEKERIRKRVEHGIGNEVSSNVTARWRAGERRSNPGDRFVKYANG